MPSKRKKKDHEDNLRLVCFFCKQRTSNRCRELTESQKKLIETTVFEDFRKYEAILMKGVCDTCCRSANDQIKKAKIGEESSRKLPTLNYSEIVATLQKIPAITRSNPTCSCFVCKISKGESCIKPGKIEKKVEEKQCRQCYGIKKPGGHKVCNRHQRVTNLMKELTPKTRLQLGLETIRVEQRKKATNSPVRVSRLSGGPSMPISIGSTEKIETK